MMSDMQLSAGWGHAWGPVFGLALAGLLVMFLGGAEGKRLGDVSWYGPVQKIHAAVLTALYVAMGIFAVFLPMGTETVVEQVGIGLMVAASVFLALSFGAYATTPVNVPVRKGVYKLSRNPIYLFNELFLLGVALCTESWVFGGMLAAYAIVEHLLILAEERHCLAAYGDSYRLYMDATARYLPVPLLR